MAQAPITFAGSANAGVNVSTTEAALTTPAAFAQQNGSSWLVNLVGNLPAGAYSSFSVRVGPAGNQTDNLVCVLQNNIVSFVQAQNDGNVFAQSAVQLPPQFYAFPLQSNLKSACLGSGLAFAQLVVTLTAASTTSNQGLVSVYSTQPANVNNPLCQVAGLVGSNTLVANATMLLTVTGMVGNTYSSTATLAPLNMGIANVAVANGSMTSVVNGSN